MIIIVEPIKRQTIKIKCPHCKYRICDIDNDEDVYVETIKSNKSKLIIKCHKCGKKIGISDLI